MARPLTASQIIAALEKWDVKYKEYPGWRTRTRPGGLTDVVGIGNHHTGGGSASASYLKFLFETGRPEDGIPGPLCNVATDTSGVVHLGAIGRCNHFGSGSDATRDVVEAEDYRGFSAEIKPGPDGVNGNPIFYGNEWIYSGTKPPSAAQYAAAVRYNAAICDAHGWTALSCIAHREWTRRKSDPFGVLMYKFRVDVAALLKAGPPVTTPLEETVTPAQMTELKNHITAEVRRFSIWELRWLTQTEDERVAARAKYDAAIAAGKTPAEAAALVIADLAPLDDQLEETQKG